MRPPTVVLFTDVRCVLDLQQDSVGISEKKGVLMDGKYKFYQ
jgi:hypothetical protein